jgi:hypothetical protein
MEKKEKIQLSLFISSLVLIAFIIGDFWKSITMTFVVIVVFSIIDALIHVKSFNKNLLNRAKDIGSALSFSLLIAIILLIGLPYALFHNSFLNIFAIQYLYIFPVLLVFFASFYIFNHLIQGLNIDYKRLLKFSLIITIVLSLIISTIALISLNITTDSRDRSHTRSFLEQTDEHKEKTESLYSDYIIFDEIREYEKNILDESNQEYLRLINNQRICFSDKCLRNVGEESVNLIKYIISLMTIQDKLKEADSELQMVQNGSYVEIFNTLENYSNYLQDRVDSFNYDLPKLDYHEEELNSLSNSFSYYDLNTFNNYLPKGDSFGGWSDIVTITSVNSPLSNSIVYTLKHSYMYKEVVRLVIKMTLYTKQQALVEDIFVGIYENRSADESMESRIIRNKIILRKIDPYFDYKS